MYHISELCCAVQQGGSEKLTDEAIEETLEKVVKLLAYISDKDLFAEFYRKKLARRLLNDRSSSDEHERSVLSRLKQQCGAQFTSKVCHNTAVHCSVFPYCGVMTLNLTCLGGCAVSDFCITTSLYNVLCHVLH